MAMFFYQAFSKDGKKVSGYIDAPSREAVKQQLARQGIFPVKITQTTQEAQVGWYSRIFRRSVSTKEKILFTKQLSVLLKSGVPLLQALELLVEYFEGRLKSIIISLKDDIKEGSSLADAMKKFPKVFGNIYIQLVRAGEASGNLELILDRLTQYEERRAEIKKRVRGALAYPLMQLALAVVVVAFLVTKVVPSMAENISGKLPWTTQFLLDISDFIRGYYLFILIGLGLIIFLFQYWKSTPSGARTLDKIKLRLPIVSFFSKMGAVVQFSRTLGMLIESGVRLSEALDIVVNIIDNRVLADTLSEARDKIIKQGKIAQYLKQTEMFPPIAIYLIKTGEESGQLGQMLLTVAENYEAELTDRADALSAALGPITLIFMAVIVGFILLSVITPMLQQVQDIQFEQEI